VTYTDFANKVIVALYLETDGDPSARIKLDELLKKYAIPVEKPCWLNNLQNDWAANGHAQFVDVGKGRANTIAITVNGTRQAEALAPTVSLTAQALPELEEPQSVDYQIENDFPETRFDSAAWTGVERRIASQPGLVEEICRKVNEIDRLIETSGLTNAERAKAKAISGALKQLIESPEPEWKAIVALLRSPTLSNVVGLAALVQLVLKLVFGIG
jgi:hypothetical protein